MHSTHSIDVRSSPEVKSKTQILIVEDNADQRYLFDWILSERYPEVEPIWKNNPSDVIEYLEACLKKTQRVPQLILLDLYLPTHSDGYHLLETIKTHYLFRLLPVVVLSSSRNPNDVREAYMLRTNSYIVKPQTYDEWLQCFHFFQQYWGHTVTLPSLS